MVLRLFYSFFSLHMSSSLPDKYRAYDKTDIVEIRRNPEADFNPEPTTIPKVSMLFPLDDNLGIQALLRRV